MAINVKPLGDRVLAKPLEDFRHGEKEGSGRDRRSRRHWQARRQWQEDRHRQSRRQSPHLQIRGTEIKIDGEDYLIMRADDILGIIG
jgi:hypothetical protein